MAGATLALPIMLYTTKSVPQGAMVCLAAQSAFFFCSDAPEGLIVGLQNKKSNERDILLVR